MRLRAIAILALLLLLSGFACAQGLPHSGSRSVSPERLGTIRGSVVMPDGTPVSSAVKVTLKVLRGDQAMLYTDQQGRFEFINLIPAQYTIEVDADRERRFEILRETVQVERGAGPSVLTLYLKERQGEVHAGADKTVSVGTLNQQVPSAAKREFDKASRFSSEGHALEAIAALKRAIVIYPDYLAAHNDLGLQLLDQGLLEEAANELQAAVKIDPKAFNPQLNLGMVLLRQDKFSESLAALDKALSLEPSAPAAHLFAGLASIKLNDTARGEKELNAAYDLGGTTYAVALLHLGKLHMKRGERETALKLFESYLRESPNAPDADQVEKLIAMLRLKH